MTTGNIAELAATAFIALLAVFAVDLNNWVLRRNSGVAEEPSSEPTAKNYCLREEFAQNRGVLRWPCGRFEQSDTGESCGVEMAERESVDSH